MILFKKSTTFPRLNSWLSWLILIVRSFLIFHSNHVCTILWSLFSHWAMMTQCRTFNNSFLILFERWTMFNKTWTAARAWRIPIHIVRTCWSIIPCVYIHLFRCLMPLFMCIWSHITMVYLYKVARQLMWWTCSYLASTSMSEILLTILKNWLNIHSFCRVNSRFIIKLLRWYQMWSLLTCFSHKVIHLRIMLLDLIFFTRF